MMLKRGLKYFAVIEVAIFVVMLAFCALAIASNPDVNGAKGVLYIIVGALMITAGLAFPVACTLLIAIPFVHRRAEDKAHEAHTVAYEAKRSVADAARKQSNAAFVEHYRREYLHRDATPGAEPIGTWVEGYSMPIDKAVVIDIRRMPDDYGRVFNVVQAVMVRPERELVSFTQYHLDSLIEVGLDILLGGSVDKKVVANGVRRTFLFEPSIMYNGRV